MRLLSYEISLEHRARNFASTAILPERLCRYFESVQDCRSQKNLLRKKKSYFGVNVRRLCRYLVVDQKKCCVPGRKVSLDSKRLVRQRCKTMDLIPILDWKFENVAVFLMKMVEDDSFNPNNKLGCLQNGDFRKSLVYCVKRCMKKMIKASRKSDAKNP